MNDPIEKELERIEFHRNAVALMPDASDPRPGIAFLVEGQKTGLTQHFCSCSISEKGTCDHKLQLARIYKRLRKELKEKGFDDDFRASIWDEFAQILGENCRETLESVHMDLFKAGEEQRLRIFGSEGDEIFSYLSDGADRERFLERCEKKFSHGIVPNRAVVLDRLALMTLTENERAMNSRGVETRRQLLEKTFWHRALYHCYREQGNSGCTFHPAVEEVSGAFTITCRKPGGKPLCRVVIPRSKVRRLLILFQERLPNQHGLAIHPIPLKSIFKVTADTHLDLDIRPMIRIIQENGEDTFLEREDLSRYMYGDLVYIPEMAILAELERPGDLERKFKAPRNMVLKKSQVPKFLEQYGEEILDASNLLVGNRESLRIVKDFDRIDITPRMLDKDWCWLSITYGFGNLEISLSEILSAKKEGRRYIGTEKGWFDCEAAILEGIDSFLENVEEGDPASEKGTIRLLRRNLFRLTGGLMKAVNLKGDTQPVQQMRKMLDLKPVEPLLFLEGMRSSLRPYQTSGVEWIRFLFENRFGGLLCDDMGLGKTHEVIAFMVSLREHEGIEGPFLVVCPTTVLSHWDRKIRDHAPGLNPVVYHNPDRDLQKAGANGSVLLTSYGILRRDMDKLREIPFPLAIFDEIQNIKNPQTQGYTAAETIQAQMKLGVTGTPIENSLMELKALLDLTLPGYLGTDKDFETRFAKETASSDLPTRKLGRLSRLISPFVLRRRKDTVLDDLPEKIEDIRTCRLSDDQVKLYRDAISDRGRSLVQILKSGEEAVPYMHIFALLSLLKQICNHPALVEEGTAEGYDRYASGKWELFKELLDESLDSGQKVVVYSQYLKMIRIMECYLENRGVEYAVLTGKSRNRGQIIERFNHDPACRVYVGSLKAGSTGIDLVAASVVIHYDRWWNAAKEDQATDRVHRIGQNRGVQVFKLVTEGTLEEKIAALIEKKRNLLDHVVKENDPGLLKGLTKDELIELLSGP